MTLEKFKNIEVKKTMPEMVTLVLNGIDEVEVDRELISNSCLYFNRLLNGPFIESKKSRINIFLSKYYSFKCFKNIIDYATTGLFIRSNDFDLLFQMIQLAKLWLYDEMVELVEYHLADNVNQRTMLRFYNLALQLKLENLREKCLMVEEQLEIHIGNVRRNWARCGLPGHQDHHYFNCKPHSSDYGDSNFDDSNEDLEVEKIFITKFKENDLSSSSSNRSERSISQDIVLQNSSKELILRR